MAEWLQASFGPTLCQLFFEPFHERYTGGLWREIMPQDDYKSPVRLSLVVHGALAEVPPAGYNVQFVYPMDGLNRLAQRMAERCVVHYGHRAVRIDTRARVVCFEDGSEVQYQTLLSTLPLNRAIRLSELNIGEPADPSVSVLVINIGAKKGARCPEDHWVYIPRSRARFHRVGFYSNVDASFLPKSSRASGDRVSIYVERAFRDGERPQGPELSALCQDVVREIQEWKWIGEAEVVDPTWIDVAYTWSWCGSRWKEQALQALESHRIYQIGRFARWIFQGIADSIRDGLMVGATFRL
jgi:protoporphyrinogen oxidase